jgi:hypothetical protein
MLRSLSYLALIVTALAPVAEAQRGKAVGDVHVEAELFKLEDSWAAGLVRRDGALFQRLLAPGFVYTEDDKLMTRDVLLREITSGTDTVTAARNDGMQAHLFGESTAIVTGWLIINGRGPGGAFTRRFRYTDTWVRLKGNWQIVAAQDYLAK